MNEWIKVEDDLPPEGQTVICYCATIVLGFYVKIKIPQENHIQGWNRDWPSDNDYKETFETYPVTHWMPLPEFPKE